MTTDAPELSDLEQFAVELATLAGAEITAAISRELMIDYKGEAGSLRDPVSDVDRNVEVLLRARLAGRFPTHGILGEEMEESPAPGGGIVWAVDPVDGTTNFINGFPFFCASVGALHHGRPVVGALWCSASHLLRAGIYHARADGLLQFDGQPIVRARHPQLKRRLAGDPGGPAPANQPWDSRRTGSAAIECAFVALGVLQVTRFLRPHVWDVAGGIALAKAAGRSVLVREADGWRPFERFPVPGGDVTQIDARAWAGEMLIGEPEAVEVASSLYS